MTDSSEIDALVATFYAAFDNRDGRAPRTEALRATFTVEGRVTKVSGEGIVTWTVDEFIAPRAAMLTDGTLTDFHEWEVEAETTVTGAIASRRSVYRKAGTLNGAPYEGEGRKFLQLCRDGGEWRIVSVLWQDD